MGRNARPARHASVGQSQGQDDPGPAAERHAERWCRIFRPSWHLSRPVALHRAVTSVREAADSEQSQPFRHKPRAFARPSWRIEQPVEIHLRVSAPRRQRPLRVRQRHEWRSPSGPWPRPSRTRWADPSRPIRSAGETWLQLIATGKGQEARIPPCSTIRGIGQLRRASGSSGS
jgi:hypothetical protein